MGKKRKTITAWVCRGSDCRKSRRWRELNELLAGCGRVAEVRCQKICDGPVAGVEVDGELTWFEELDNKKVLVDLVELAQGGRMSKRLKDRRVKKRKGKLR